MELELVLPCYNESKSIRTLVERASKAASEAGMGPNDFQLVLVENGSKDNSSTVMGELKTGPLGVWFRKVPVSPNEGYGNGIWKGLQTTTAQYVAWSHADQQCDPKDVFEALKVLKANGGSKLLVKGVRQGRGFKDNFVSRVFESMAYLFLGLRMYEMNAQPKVFSRALLSKLTNPPKTFAFDLYVLYHAAKAGYRILTIPVLFPPRFSGVSNWAASWTSRYKTILGMIGYMRQLGSTEGRLGKTS